MQPTAHFPGRAPIDAYGNGGFRFADMSHRGSIMVMPSGISAWDVHDPDDLQISDFALLETSGARPQFMLVGTGRDMMPVDDDVRCYLRNLGISSDIMNTGAAVRTYNILLAEDRDIGAALIAVA